VGRGDTGATSSPGGDKQLRRRPGATSSKALREHLDAVIGTDGVHALGTVVDAVMGARRLAAWSLWVELAAIARLITVWKGHPPILDERLGPDPCEDADPGLAARLHRVISDLELDIRPWGSPPLNTAELAEEFVVNEIAAATGLSFTRARQRADAAVALFLTDRLPRTAALLQAGLLDETKLRTLLSNTAELDDRVCRIVEARVIVDADLDVADPLDVGADPRDLHARPGSTLPAVTRMTNPALERALRAAILTVDAEAAARRAAKARRLRSVRATALPDGMGALTVETGQEVIASIVNDLDSCVATAKAGGDSRRPDQIRCDELVHRMTLGAFGTPACGGGAPAAAPAIPGEPGEPTEPRQAGEPGESSGRRWGRYGRRGLTVGLTMPLSTWVGLADEPGLLDGFGPIPAALARQVAAEALRDHPTTTSWRCVVVDDEHRTVLGVGDLIPSPRHDPPRRVARLVRAINPTCAYPGCPAPARRCDLDHRIPYEEGGATCSCNLQSLCRRHHRLKGTGMVDVEPVLDPEEPVGTLRWISWTGREYLHRPPEAAVSPVRRAERVQPLSTAWEEVLLPSDMPEDSSLTDDWTRSVARGAEEAECRRRREQRQHRSPAEANAGSDDPPPF
jgi:Domain of unknown function (DUF222)